MNNYQTETIFSLPSELLLLFFLIFMGGIYWSVNKRVGFQVLYLTIFSMTIAHIITLHFPYFYSNDELVPFTHPNIQALMTFFAFFIPLARHRRDVVLCLMPPAIISILLVILTATPIFSIVGGLLIGGFIVFTFYRTLEWVGGMPEFYLLVSSMLLPLFLAAILYPVELYLLYPGVLLGTGIGVTLETLKTKFNIQRNPPQKRFLAFFIGSAGLFIFYGTDQLIKTWIPLPDMTLGLVLGLWITFILPVLLQLFKVYDSQMNSREL